MKKVVAMLAILICLIFTSNICVYAANENIIDGIDTAEEDLSPDYDVFFERITKSLYGKTQSYATDEDFDYTKSIKIYNDVNIFDEDNTNSEKMREKLKYAEYVYYLPIYRDNSTYVFTVGKGLPVAEEVRNSCALTEEDIEYIERTEGRWCFTAGFILNEEYDYIKAVNEMLEYNGIENTTVYFVGGAGSGLNLIAVLCNENGDVKFSLLSGLNEDNKIIGELNRNNKLYSYEEMKELAERGGELQPDQYGGMRANVQQEESQKYTQYILVGAGAFLAVAVIAIVASYTVKKKSKASEKQI